MQPLRYGLVGAGAFGSFCIEHYRRSPLIDVRAVAASRRPGFAKRQLAAGLDKRGIAYLHLRALGLLDTTVLTVTGATLGENLDAWEKSERRARFRELLRERDGVEPDEVIMSPERARERGLVHARSHIERLFADLPGNCGIVSVLDGHPATLAWLGAVNGHRVRPLGVEHFGQTGSLPDLYRHYGIDANAIVAEAQAIAPGRPIRHLRALG